MRDLREACPAATTATAVIAGNGSVALSVSGGRHGD
jgi:hypothetical protein